MKKTIIICFLCIPFFIKAQIGRDIPYDKPLFKIFYDTKKSEKYLPPLPITSPTTNVEIVELNYDLSIINANLLNQISVRIYNNQTMNIQVTKVHNHHVANVSIFQGYIVEPLLEDALYKKEFHLVINHATNKMVGYFETETTNVQILPRENNTYILYETAKSAFTCGSGLANSQNIAFPQTATSRQNDCEEKNAAGKYVIDMFVGLSESASVFAGDPLAYAISQISTVNKGFENSQIDNVILRVVGTGITPHNPGIIPSVLSDALIWFADEIEATRADMIAIYQTPTDAPNSAGGYGGLPGIINVNGVEFINAFRHEMGHNFGGGHCVGDYSVVPYAHGYNNGNTGNRTHLCGNDINYYSNPNINDASGFPLGNATSANMARVIRERAAQYASRRIHNIPYDDEDEVLVGQPCDDGNNCTLNDVYIDNCNCQGRPEGILYQASCIRLVAKSEINNATFTSMAEIDLIADNGEMLPKNQWRLEYVNSEETRFENSPAINAFDDNISTIWHSNYSNTFPSIHPHEIWINLGGIQQFTGFSYTPRQDGGVNGTIADYDFYISEDCTNWTLVKQGTFQYGQLNIDLTKKNVFLSATDTIPPTLICNEYSIQLGNEDTIRLKEENIISQLEDNCGIGMLFISKEEFTIKDLGEQEVIITAADLSGQITTCTTIISVNTTTSNSNELIPADAIHVYPNPFSKTSTLNIEAPNIELIQATFFDLLGRPVKYYDGQTNSPIYLDRIGLNTGVYYLVLKDKQQQMIGRKKLIIK